MKIRPMGAEMFQADRRTDMTKLIVACRNFANAPKNFCNYIRRKYWPFKAYRSRDAPPTLNNCTPCSHCICVFCIYL